MERMSYEADLGELGEQEIDVFYEFRALDNNDCEIDIKTAMVGGEMLPKCFVIKLAENTDLLYEIHHRETVDRGAARADFYEEERKERACHH